VVLVGSENLGLLGKWGERKPSPGGLVIQKKMKEKREEREKKERKMSLGATPKKKLEEEERRQAELESILASPAHKEED